MLQYAAAATALLFFILAAATANAVPAVVRNASRADIKLAATLIKSDSRCPKSFVFMSASPKDQPKQPSSTSLAPTHPQLLIVIRDLATRNVHEVTVEPAIQRIVEWQRLDDRQPPLNAADIDTADRVVRSHPGWIASLERRKIDPKNVVLDVWPSSIPYSGFRFRSVRVLSYIKGTDRESSYRRPIDGLVVTVNLDARRVFEFYDKEVAPLPGDMLPTTYSTQTRTPTPGSGILGETKAPSKAPIKVDTKNGEVAWREWRFIPVVHMREGLVLHGVRRTQGKTTLNVAHRLSMAEMAVVYGDSSQYWSWRTPLLMAEMGLGARAVDQLKERLVPSNARTIGVASITPDGKDVFSSGAIALFEHLDGSLVVRSSFHVGHMTIQQSYYLHIDGELEMDVSVGGTPLARSSDEVLDVAYGAYVAKNMVVPISQVYCNFRMDLDIDGVQNVVSEVDLMSGLAGDDTYGNLVMADDYPLYREKEAVRDADPAVQRTWKVSSLGQQMSYRIILDDASKPILSASHPMRTKAGFLDHHVWVTRHDDSELYSVGRYASQSMGETTLASYVSDNESIRMKDIVVWCTQGTTIVPSASDWPHARMRSMHVRLIPDTPYNPTIE